MRDDRDPREAPRPGAPRTAAAHHPDHVGPYRILQVLGEGGMGVVYEAEQTRPVRRRVAVKIIKEGMDTRLVVARFEAERQALAVMEHPGIAKVFDAGATAEGRPYFVMELVRGVPLMEHCARHRLDTRQRIELFLQVCSAVQHAHQKGVIHRDLKPKNILVVDQDGVGRPKIIDFGVARATGQRLSEHTVVTTFGQAIGTLAYMSPEQAEMSGLDIDTRADIYSLGVTLHELIVGRVPLDPREVGAPQFLARLVEPDVSMPTLAQRIDSLGPEERASIARLHGIDVDRVKREVRGDLQWIVLKAMDKDRNRRYETANGLAMDLRRCLAHEPVVARPPSTAYRMEKFVRRHRVGVVLTGLVAILVLGFAAAMAVQANVIARERDRAEAEATKAQQVVGFLKGLFESSDPNVVAGDTLTARELLRRGLERIDAELADQPDLRADLQVAMGDVHVSLGLLDEAEALYRSSLEEGRRAAGDTSEIVATALADLGTVARQKGDLDAAEALEREALAIRRALFGEESAAVAVSLNGLGMALNELGRYQESAEVLGEALRTRQALFPHNSIEVAQTMNNLANALEHLQEYDSVEVLQRESLAIRRAVYGDRHPLVATGLNNLGLFLRDRGDLEGAERLLREALDIRRAIHGGPHPRLAPVVNNLAGVLRMKGDLEGAEPLYLESLSMRRALYGGDHPAVAIALNNLGRFYRDKGDLEESEHNYRLALEMGRRVYPPGHPALGQALRSEGVALILLHRPTEAEPVLRESVAVLESALGDDHYQTALARAELGRSFVARGMYEEAEPLLLGAHGALTSMLPEQADRAQAVAEYLVELYEAWGRPGQADPYRRGPGA